jgi:hypothetical protein
VNKTVNSRRLRWDGLAACIEEPLNPRGILAGEPERKGKLGCPRHRGQRITLKCIYKK